MALTENEYLPDTASDEFMDYVLKKPVELILIVYIAQKTPQRVHKFGVETTSYKILKKGIPQYFKEYPFYQFNH